MQALPSATPNEVANPFQFTDHMVRTATDDAGNVWFCAKDVFEALDIAWKGASGSLKNYRKKWQVVLYLQTSGGVKETIFLSEAGVYQTIFTSRKPNAEAFSDWVCEEVLPAIRRQGYYGKPSAADRLAASRQLARVLDDLVKARDAFAIELLTRELRDLCNLLGHPMPDLALLGCDPSQRDLPLQSKA